MSSSCFGSSKPLTPVLIALGVAFTVIFWTATPALAEKASGATTGSISGSVTRESSGSPVENVWVFAFDGESKYGGAWSGSEGDYTISDLAPGTYSVEFDPTLVDESLASEYWQDSPSPQQAEPVTVNAGQTFTGIDASLASVEELASITGRVTADHNDEPLPGIFVQATSPSGREHATTDENGNYVISQLPPDSYEVTFGPGDAHIDAHFDSSSLERATRQVTVETGAISGIDASLVVGGLIEGAVKVERPLDGESWRVRAYRWDGNGWAEQAVILGNAPFWNFSFLEYGKFLPAGEYTVGVEYPEHCTQYWDGENLLMDADRFTLKPFSLVSEINIELTTDCGQPTVLPGTPSVLGAPSVGQTLNAETGGWTPRLVAFEYQWMADGEPISGATGPALVLTDAILGKMVSVQITGSHSGYDSATETSEQVGPVLAGVEETPGNPHEESRSSGGASSERTSASNASAGTSPRPLASTGVEAPFGAITGIVFLIAGGVLLVSVRRPRRRA